MFLRVCYCLISVRLIRTPYKCAMRTAAVQQEARIAHGTQPHLIKRWKSHRNTDFFLYNDVSNAFGISVQVYSLVMLYGSAQCMSQLAY